MIISLAPVAHSLNNQLLFPIFNVGPSCCVTLQCPYYMHLQSGAGPGFVNKFVFTVIIWLGKTLLPDSFAHAFAVCLSFYAAFFFVARHVPGVDNTAADAYFSQ